MLNTAMVVLGGGVMKAIGEEYLSKLKRTIARYTFSDIYAECDFKLAKLGYYIGIYGSMEIVASEF